MHAPANDIAALRSLAPGAVDAVFDAYADRIHGFLRRLGAPPQVAEDLVQETFVRLVRHAPRLRDDTRVGAWLFTVARNLWRSHCRWAWLDGTRLLGLALPERPPTPVEAHAASEAQRRAEVTVAALPLPQREVYLLVVVEGLSPQEAADALGIAPEAARQRLSRARRALEEALR